MTQTALYAGRFAEGQCALFNDGSQVGYEKWIEKLVTIQTSSLTFLR